MQLFAHVVALGALIILVQGEDIQCLDKSYCPAGTSCCALYDGSCGCCPYEEAVCCHDQIHCCPSNTHCHEDEGRCFNHAKSVSHPMKKKLPSRPHHASIFKLENDIACDEGQHFCHAEDRCTPLKNGEFGCCPMHHTSCADEVHCCMEGSFCDEKNFNCVQPDGGIRPMLKKVPARKPRALEDKVTVPVKAVKCPDGKSQCPDGTTCCSVGGDQYGCCPVPNAVCCTDHMHCCPEGTHCHVTEGRCLNHQTDFSSKWLKKFPATPLIVKDQQAYQPNVFVFDEEPNGPPALVCPDQSTCGPESTCCPTSEMWGMTMYSCCPLSGAACCAEGCCPHGFTCSAERKCEKSPVWYGNRHDHHRHH